jgi:hypothetical protein
MPIYLTRRILSQYLEKIASPEGEKLRGGIASSQNGELLVGFLKLLRS